MSEMKRPWRKLRVIFRKNDLEMLELWTHHVDATTNEMSANGLANFLQDLALEAAIEKSKVFKFLRVFF